MIEDSASGENEIWERGHWGAWREAKTFAELTTLATRFLEGELDCFPGWMAPDIDEETDALVPSLVAACKSGFLPTASQPGACPALSHDGLPWRQRAFVLGFATPAFLEGLTARLESQQISQQESNEPIQLGIRSRPSEGASPRASRLILRSFRATEARQEEPIVAAKQGERAYLWVGGAEGPNELELFAERLEPPVIDILSQCHYLCLLDPEWGQDDVLWPILEGLQAPSHP